MLDVSGVGDEVTDTVHVSSEETRDARPDVEPKVAGALRTVATDGHGAIMYVAGWGAFELMRVVARPWEKRPGAAEGEVGE
jgi:hypothetical protein